MANTIAVYNFKGGVGKTSTTLSLAYSWSRAYKVLVIDCDPQSNLSQSLLDSDYDQKEHNLYELTSKFLHNSIPDINPIKINPYLDLIQGDFRMSTLESNNQFISFGQTIIYGLLTSVRNKYDLILLDFPTHFGVTGLLRTSQDVFHLYTMLYQMLLMATHLHLKSNFSLKLY